MIIGIAAVVIAVYLIIDLGYVRPKRDTEELTLKPRLYK